MAEEAFHAKSLVLRSARVLPSQAPRHRIPAWFNCLVWEAGKVEGWVQRGRTG